MSEEFLPVTCEKVNSFLRRKAESELNEDESRTRFEILQLKKMADRVWRSSICSADDVLRALQALIHFCLEYPATQIGGFCFVFDNHLASLDTLHLFLKYATVLAPTVTAFPGRFQLIAVVNTNFILRGLSPLLLSIMPSKLKKRTSFYGEAKTALPEIFDPSILPEEFGGILGPVTSLYHSWITDLEQYVPKLRATNKYFKRKNTVSFPEEDAPCQ